MKTISIIKIDGIWQAIYNDGSTVFAEVYDSYRKETVRLPISAHDFELCQGILLYYLGGGTNPFNMALADMARFQEMQPIPVKVQASFAQALDGPLIKRALRELLRQISRQNAALVDVLKHTVGKAQPGQPDTWMVDILQAELTSETCETNVLLAELAPIR